VALIQDVTGNIENNFTVEHRTVRHRSCENHINVHAAGFLRMDLAGSYHLITGAGRGIGRALATGLAARGAAGVALVDVSTPTIAAQAAAAAATHAEFQALPIAADVSSRDGVRAAIASALDAFDGRMDGLISNAGVAAIADPRAEFSAVSETASTWAASMNVNCMAHVWAAEAIVPHFEQSPTGGAFVSIVSAAGLLTQVGAPSYSVSKAAAFAFSTSLSVHHGDRGVRVHCVCPQAVATSLVGLSSEDPHAPIPQEAVAGGAGDGVLSPQAVAAATLDAMESGQFLVLPHAQVQSYAQMRMAAPDKWLRGMRKLRDAIRAGKTPLVQGS
jgi:NAD(P)-dependent dehydrogenase (short-subunit alcohol dehydrogenase family)